MTTPMSFMNTPRLKPVPTAFEKASLAAKRLARVPARGVRTRGRLGSLDVGEDAIEEALAETLERILDPLDVAKVGADADDHRACVHQVAHPADAGLEPGEDRLADQEMADVEFGELRNRGDRRDIVERQAVAGMRLDAVLDGQRCAVGDALSSVARSSPSTWA